MMIEELPSIDEYKPELDNRFVYEKMLVECDELKNIQDKILLIHDRLYYFKQWVLQYDVEEMFLYKFSPTYYPNFEKLCKMELERLNNKLELEKKLSIPSIKTTESKPSEVEPAGNPYKWNSSNNDLIELVTAMFMVNALKREDGAKITQTELTDFFEELFNLEVKNDKATRAYISDPLTTRPLFLEKLMGGFKKYRESKIEKKPDIIKTRNTGY
jgi:6-pyruvoyl-tetrahydropterin synthase